MLNLIFTLMAFVAGFMLVFGVNLWMGDVAEKRRKQVKRRLDEEFRLQQRERARTSLNFRNLHEIASEDAESEAIGMTLRERMELWIEQSGVRFQLWTLTTVSIVAGVVPAVLSAIIFRGILATLFPLIIFGGLPWFFVAWKRRQRGEKLISQLPEALELMSRMLRAGQTTSQSLQGVADEFAEPIAAEFAYCYEQQNLGLSPQAAMRDLARRTGLLEYKIFVVAVTIHREAGGNLSQLLDRLSTVIRDRFRIRGQIKSLTAEGRLQGVILCALPPLILMALMVVNRRYAMMLFEYPWLLVGMLVADVIGLMWMRRIVNFDF